ncbi:hypothetical protein OH76DRAFT_1266180 [Lentinus brumalis]|uniref:DUF6534 domain-containing protein n=1 Tax=Lentinus brumalis TaxID=2498619 RepID=A0A371CR42_9APHY|nr:hypothetical protein OH76DRAFT_1266180 [Polyporus brumalis]
MATTPVDTSATLAPMLIGTALSLIPYGISLHQMFIYARRGQRSDGPFIRNLVLIAALFDTLELAFGIHFCYFYMVTNYFNPSALGHTVWSLNCSIIAGSCVMLFTQIFFLRRVSMIEFRQRLVVYAATAFVLIKFGLAVSLTARALVFADDQANVYMTSETMTALMYACGTLASIMLTSTLLVVLFRVSASQRDIRGVIDWIMVYCVNTGVLICISDLLSMVAVVASPHTLWWTVPAQFTIKFYLNTLFSVLNSRKQQDTNQIVLGADSGIPTSIARANRIANAERWNVPQLPDKAPPMMDVVVTTEVEDDVSADSMFNKHPRPS